MDKDIVELALVMPVYNEQEIIRQTVTDWEYLLKQLDINYEFHIYDDGSEDNTPKILKELAGANPKIIPHFQARAGHGPTSLLGCRENSGAKWIFLTDSGNDASFKNFGRMWGMRRTYYFIAARRKRTLKIEHFIISALSGIIIKILYGRGIADANSPCRLMFCNAFRDIFQNIPENTYAPNLIITGEACRRQIALYELQIDSYHTKAGSGYYARDITLTTAFKALYQTILFRIKSLR
jgi:glycosyltransferase involved in cell wall biosynthesis